MSAPEYHVRVGELGIKCESKAEAIGKAKIYNAALIVEIKAGIEKPILLWNGDQLLRIRRNKS